MPEQNTDPREQAQPVHAPLRESDRERFESAITEITPSGKVMFDEGPTRIDASVYVDTKRGLMWVCGSPWDIADVELDESDAEELHNCDAMGCGSVGSHVLAIVRIKSRPEHGQCDSEDCDTNASEGGGS